MRHSHRAGRRRLHMRLSQLIWEWRNRAYLSGACGLALLTAVYIANGGIRGLP